VRLLATDETGSRLSGTKRGHCDVYQAAEAFVAYPVMADALADRQQVKFTLHRSDVDELPGRTLDDCSSSSLTPYNRLLQSFLTSSLIHYWPKIQPFHKASPIDSTTLAPSGRQNCLLGLNL